ncbi:hypothetical protein CQA62_00930 [Helicobacter cholecystus]|uniref:Uncharacterized protein n=1 Tax=Helicobacter cholecystus TaxID=45498 RepID=A0A3D8IXM0_9HELI|nr:hypothetical protein CQA62_00930 [Helicobacter cholecystus]
MNYNFSFLFPFKLSNTIYINFIFDFYNSTSSLKKRNLSSGENDENILNKHNGIDFKCGSFNGYGF